jgi:hypothetical protein
MQDPEFEKEVREKMSELKFSPSESVWTSVQQQIAKDKIKRPLFWIFILGGMMLVGSLYFFLGERNPISRKVDTPLGTIKTSADKSSPATFSQSSAVASHEQRQNPETVSKHFHKEVNPSSAGKATVLLSTNQSEISANSGNLENNKRTGKPEEKFPVKKNKDLPSKPVIAADQPIAAANMINNSAGKLDGASMATTKSIKSPGAADSATSRKTKQDDHSKLRFGFTGAMGMSDIFRSQVTTQTVYAAYALPVTFSLAAAPGLAHGPPAIQPGFSFSAGVVAEKKISKKLLFSFGLNYQYYSSSVQTGAKIDSTLYSSQVTGYYAWGNSTQYTNKYHFLELPVSLGFELNASKKIPMFLEAGLTLSQMVAAKAIQYDYLSGNYFESKSNFSKTQLMGNAAYLFGLKQKGIILKAGPQVQYAFTNLGGSSPVGKEHLFFAGIRFIILPKK